MGRVAGARVELEKRLAGRSERNRGDRVYAAHGLARLGGAESLAALQTALGHKDANTRRAAALALGVLGRGDEKTGVLLSAMLRDDPDASCRGSAAIGLGRTAPRGAKEALLSMLGARDANVSPYAALGVGLLAVTTDDIEPLRPLVAMLRDERDDSLRGAVACALGIGRIPEAAPVLLEIVQERGDPKLRAHAAFALGRLDAGIEERQALRELLIEREHPWMPREAALALGSLRDAASARMLGRLLESETSLHLQAAAALAMGSIGGDQSGAVLTALLEDATKKPITRAMAAVALGRMLDRGGEERLAIIGADLDWHLFTPAVQEILTIL
jgi:HEAT repeat protein